MDIDLLSKMVKDRLLDSSEVILPGVGMFESEIVPSTFADKGYTVNPPYRRLYFRQLEEADDRIISDLYAASNNIDKELSYSILKDFLSEMKAILHTKKTLEFPGLGRLRATRENNIFFVPDEDLDLYPQGFGLEPLSLKSLTKPIQASILTEPFVDSTETESSQASSEIVEVPTSESSVPVESESVGGHDIEKVPIDDSDVQNIASCDVKNMVSRDVQNIASCDVKNMVSRDVQNVVSPDEQNVEDVSDNSASVATEDRAKSQRELAEDSTDRDVIVLCQESIEEDATASAREEESVSEPSEEKKPGDGLDIMSKENGQTISRQRRFRRAVILTVCIVVTLSVISLAAFLLLAHFAPDFIDSILYTPEQLEILKYKL